MFFAFVLVMAAFSKMKLQISSFTQAVFAFASLGMFLAGKTRIGAYGFFVSLSIFIWVTIGVASNQGDFVLGFKNSLYLILLPLMVDLIKVDWLEKNFKFVIWLSFSLIVWYLMDNESYLTRELAGYPRMVGFGVNPNVWGSICVLLLIQHRLISRQLFKNFNVSLITIIFLLGCYLSRSSTAILCLPLVFIPRRWFCLSYVTVFSVLILVTFLYFQTQIRFDYPSLYARFALWDLAISDLDIKTLLIGNGYDTFGGVFGSLSSSSIKIVDSFYISAVISGGVVGLLLISFVYFIVPLYYGIKGKDTGLIQIVTVFMLINTMGNFLENGFPVNIIYWLLVQSRIVRANIDKHRKSPIILDNNSSPQFVRLGWKRYLTS